MSKKSFLRRRNFVLHKKLQYSMLFISIGYAVFIVIVLAASLFVPLMLGMNRADYASKEAFEAANTILFIHKRFWMPGLLCLVAIGIHSIRTSHRIAGPIFRLNRLLNTLEQGTVPERLHNLRKNDYLVDEFEQINRVLDNIRSNLNEIQTNHSTLSKLLAKDDKSLDRSSKDELVKIIKKISDKNTKLRESVEYFKIESSPDQT